MTTRTYTSGRANLLKAIAEKLKDIDGSGAFLTDLQNNVHPRLKFWDEVDVFPTLHMSAGTETRQYYGGGQKFRYLTVTIRVYVNSEEPIDELEELLEDVETVIDDAGQFNYYASEGTQNILQTSIVSISTDEGAIHPMGIGEMLVEVRY